MLLKIHYMAWGILFLSLVATTGCLNNYGLSEEQKLTALDKYSASYLNLQRSDSDGTETTKIVLRSLLAPISLGISEAILAEERENIYYEYSRYLYFTSFLGKNKRAIIDEFGAPHHQCAYDNNGQIFAYDRIYHTGGDAYYTKYGTHYTPVVMHREINEFYFNAAGICYQWKQRKE